MHAEGTQSLAEGGREALQESAQTPSTSAKRCCKFSIGTKKRGISHLYKIVRKAGFIVGAGYPDISACLSML